MKREQMRKELEADIRKEMAAEREKADKEKAEKEQAEKEKANKEKADKETAEAATTANTAGSAPPAEVVED